MASSASSTGEEPKYWDSDWFKKSVEDVKAENSLENKVDQLWQSILTPLFPFKEGYLVVGRDRVVDDDRKSADLMVKLLRNDQVTVVFTMSNKRTKYPNLKENAKEQLESYLGLECKNGTYRGIDIQGAIGIGTKVSFYEYRPIRTMSGPRELILIKELDVLEDQKKVQDRLEKIKRAATRGRPR